MTFPVLLFQGLKDLRNYICYAMLTTYFIRHIPVISFVISENICNFATDMDKNLYIISGCNGAGKTTASYTVLPEILDCDHQVHDLVIQCSSLL